MKDSIKEQLSVLLDDELDEAEQALLLRQLSRNPELCSRLSRYQLISDAMHDNLPRCVDPAFHTRVTAALPAQGPARAAAPVASRLLRPAAGLALAASVAVVAVVSLQNVREQSPASPQAVASAHTADGYIRAQDTPVPVASVHTAPGLDIYLVNHNEYAVNPGMQGMLPYVRIVGNETQLSGDATGSE